MRMSTVPNAFTASATMLSAPFLSETEAPFAMASPPAFLISLDDGLRGRARAARAVDRAAEVVHDDLRAALGELERVVPAEAARRHP